MSDDILPGIGAGALSDTDVGAGDGPDALAEVPGVGSLRYRLAQAHEAQRLRTRLQEMLQPLARCRITAATCHEKGISSVSPKRPVSNGLS